MLVVGKLSLSRLLSDSRSRGPSPQMPAAMRQLARLARKPVRMAASEDKPGLAVASLLGFFSSHWSGTEMATEVGPSAETDD